MLHGQAKPRVQLDRQPARVQTLQEKGHERQAPTAHLPCVCMCIAHDASDLLFPACHITFPSHRFIFAIDHVCICTRHTHLDFVFFIDFYRFVGCAVGGRGRAAGWEAQFRKRKVGCVFQPMTLQMGRRGKLDESGRRQSLQTRSNMSDRMCRIWHRYAHHSMSVYELDSWFCTVLRWPHRTECCSSGAGGSVTSGRDKINLCHKHDVNTWLVVEHKCL